MRMRSMRLPVQLLALAITLAIASLIPAARAAGPLDKINHVVVIYQVNWSFDSLYGAFPGANGIANAGAAVKQVDKNGQPITALPQPIDTNQRPAAPDARFPANMPVQPFNIAQYVPPDQKIGDLVHRFY